MRAFDKDLVLYLKQKGLVPEALRRFLQKHINVMELRAASWIAQDPFANDLSASTYESKYPHVLGIIKEFWHLHWHYIAACRDVGVAYKVLDISGPDWQKVIETSGCDAFLVRPSVQVSIWKQMYDERLRIMTKDMGKIIFPSYDELWFWESKRRMHYWLHANDVPYPKTWIFYDRKAALRFAEQTPLPIVFKSDMGSGATGVIIFRERSCLKKHILRCFGRGFTTYRKAPNDREWGNIFLQEYIENAREWRIIRIGESYFGYEKLMGRGFHSGSHRSRHGLPPADLLDLAQEVTDKGKFLSMDLDILVTPGTRPLVNELQPIFGMEYTTEACIVDGKTGRMLYDTTHNSWQFEAGSFCRNQLCNLRVIALLETLGREHA